MGVTSREYSSLLHTLVVWCTLRVRIIGVKRATRINYDSSELKSQIEVLEIGEEKRKVLVYSLGYKPDQVWRRYIENSATYIQSPKF